MSTEENYWAGLAGLRVHWAVRLCARTGQQSAAKIHRRASSSHEDTEVRVKFSEKRQVSGSSRTMLHPRKEELLRMFPHGYEYTPHQGGGVAAGVPVDAATERPKMLLLSPEMQNSENLLACHERVHFRRAEESSVKLGRLRFHTRRGGLVLRKRSWTQETPQCINTFM